MMVYFATMYDVDCWWVDTVNGHFLSMRNDNDTNTEFRGWNYSWSDILFIDSLIM